MVLRAARCDSIRSVRNKLLGLTFGISSLLAGTGCGGPVLEIKHQQALPAAPAASVDCNKDDDPTCKLPGVPFYGVAYRCVHSTSWLRPIYVVSVTVTKVSDDSTVAAASKVFDLTAFTTDPVKTAILKIKSSAPVDDYNPLLTDLTKIPDSDPSAFKQERLPNSPEKDNSFLAANVVAADRYVSTQAVYYYNVHRPFNGSANAEVDLNGEGILTKGSGQAEEKTLDTILNMIGTLGAAALGTPPTAAAATPAPPAAAPQVETNSVNFAEEKKKPKEKPPEKYKFTVQIDTKVYKYTHSTPVTGATPPCTPTAALVGADGKEAYDSTFEDVTAGATTEKPADKAKGDKPKSDKPKK